MIADTMHPDIPVVPQRTPTGTLTTAPPSIERRESPPQDPMVARSLLGLADLPTIVALGPFDDLVHVHHLAAAFTVVQRFCRSQLVLLGAGARRAVTRRAVPRSAGSRVHMFDDAYEQLWSEVVAAADFVVLSPASGSIRLLNVLAAGRAVVTPDDPTTVRLVVAASAGLVYRPGDITGMTSTISRLLTKPSLRDGMATRAREVARRYQQSCAPRYDEGNGYV